MTRLLITLSLPSLLVCGLLLSGCGGESKAPQSTEVISPAAEKPAEPEAPAEEPEAAAEPEAPAEEPMPETTEPEPEATPESEPEPASTPEPAETPAPAETTEPAEKEEPAEAEEPAADAGQSATDEDASVPVSVTLGAQPGGTTFKGRVTVQGTATSASPFDASKDPFCIDLGKLPDDTLVVGEGGGIGNVFVWLRKVPSGVDVPAVPEEPAVLDNVKCNFLPHAFAMRVGQPLFVKNADNTAHNTRISPVRNNAFNQTIGPNDRTGVEVVYSQEELVPIKAQCDIHPWMGNFHFPVNHPWVAVTDKNGNFEITGLPAGDLEFRMWHERVGYVERSIEVTTTEGETVEKSFEVDASKLAE